MKVKIGSYPNRLICDIHTNYMNKKYGFDWPNYEPKGLKQNHQPVKEAFLEKVEDAVQSFYNVLNWVWFDRRSQKISVRIDKYDTWSMDHTLAPIILPMLKQLKESKHGAPQVDDEDVPAELMAKYADEKGDPNTGSTDSNWFKRWDWVMDEMIWAFEQKCRDDWESDYYGPYVGEPFKGEFEWMNMKGRKAHQERMSNGFRLFGKYYEGLWD